MSDLAGSIIALKNAASGRLLGLYNSSGLKVTYGSTPIDVNYAALSIPYAAIGRGGPLNFKEPQNLWRVYKAPGDGMYLFESFKHKGVFLTENPVWVPFSTIARTAVGKTQVDTAKVPGIKLLPVGQTSTQTAKRFNLQLGGNYLTNSTPGAVPKDITGAYDSAGFSGVPSPTTAQQNAAFQWDVIEINKVKCCMGVVSETSDQNVCAEWWKSGVACDNYMNSYCSINQNDSACSCLNSPVKKYNPLCIDGTCLRNAAYVSQNMMALPCPNIVDCSIVFDLQNVGRDTIFTDAQIKQACGTPDETPVTPPTQQPSQPSHSPAEPSQPTQPSYQDQTAIWQDPTFLFILFLLIWVIAFGIIYKYMYKTPTAEKIKFEF